MYALSSAKFIILHSPNKNDVLQFQDMIEFQSPQKKVEYHMVTISEYFTTLLMQFEYQAQTLLLFEFTLAFINFTI